MRSLAFVSIPLLLAVGRKKKARFFFVVEFFFLRSKKKGGGGKKKRKNKLSKKKKQRREERSNLPPPPLPQKDPSRQASKGHAPSSLPPRRDKEVPRHFQGTTGGQVWAPPRPLGRAREGAVSTKKKRGVKKKRKKKSSLEIFARSHNANFFSFRLPFATPQPFSNTSSTHNHGRRQEARRQEGRQGESQYHLCRSRGIGAGVWRVARGRILVVFFSRNFNSREKKRSANRRKKRGGCFAFDLPLLLLASNPALPPSSRRV